MKNVKDQVYAALSSVFPQTTDQYPASWANLPAVQYVEEENKVHEYSASCGKVAEDKSYVRYRVDIWHNESTSSAALAVDRALSGIGLKRTMCQDVTDPSNLKHKVMRYEAVIDMESNAAYWL